MPADADTAAENHDTGEASSDQQQQEASRGNRAPKEGAAAEDFEAALQRAEEMVDRAGDRVSVVASRLWRQCRRATARAREEVEDMWAEAQTLRRGGASADED